MLSQNFFLVHEVTVRISSEKNNKAALAKNSADKFLWINIVDGVKIQDIMFILCFSSTLNSITFLAIDNRCRVLRY